MDNSTRKFDSQKGDQSIEFNITDGGIDSNKYSFYDVFADKQLNNYSFEDRLDMLNLWIKSLTDNNHNLYRRPTYNGCKPVIEVDTGTGLREMINMASNDYLNMSQHPEVIEATVKAIREYGTGPGGAPLLNGTTDITLKLEETLCRMKNCEAALVFTSGYTANVGAISTLMKPNDWIIYDMYSHASLIDGGKLSQKKIFKHNDMESLESVLQRLPIEDNKLVVIDGVYSMDGDIAKLDQIVEISHRYNAWVLVDEAHATGVIGENGGGTPEHFNLHNVDIITGTFSKAIGSTGGFVAGTKKLIDYIKYSSRPYMFSTAPYIPAMMSSLKSLKIIEEDGSMRKQLWKNIHTMQTELVGAGFDIGDSETAIFPLIIGDDFKVKEMSYLLDQENIMVNSVPYPAVPRKITRVRLSVTAGHTEEHLDKTISAIKKIGKKLEII